MGKYNGYMKLDRLSEKVVALILKIKDKNEGLVSEIWIDETTISEIKNAYSHIDTKEILKSARSLLNEEQDPSRKDYINKLLISIEFQLSGKATTNLVDFYKATFDYALERLSDSEINENRDKLLKLERDTKLYRHDVIKNLQVKPEDLLNEFKKQLAIYKNKLPYFLETEGNFDYEVVEKAPWGAFNYHTAPFRSKLTLNASSGITSYDLKMFAVHEAYGGHHTELSLKDKLLEQGKGEHGFVLVYSQQVFVSEGIAEAAFEIFGYGTSLTIEEQIFKAYSDLSIALTNRAVFMFHNDKNTKEEIEAYIDSYDMGKVGKANIVNFVVDEAFGKYPAVYYTARKFILDAYSNAKDKEVFLKRIYTGPCTPESLSK